MELALTLLMAGCLLFLSAAFSGLNIGLMMVRPEELKRKALQGDDVAKRVYRYRKNGNYLIVCVLLGNVSVISILTLVFDSIAGGIIAGVATTLLVTAFGEILPQSLFSRRGYRLTRYFFWLLDAIFVLFWPLAYPTSKLLDKWIGAELPSLYSHEELAHIINDHAEHQQSLVDYDESKIARGALAFSGKTVAEIATPIDKVEMVELDDELDGSLLAQVKQWGHSRLPVKNSAGEFVGVLFVKDLLGRDMGTPIGHVYRPHVYDIDDDTALDTVLSRFIQRKSHLFLVRNEADEVTGVVTLEDVIEEIIAREIEDEHDAE